MNKRILPIIIILLCLALAACGGEKAPTVYIGAAVSDGEGITPLSEVFSGDTRLTLSHGGNGSLFLDGEGGAIKWKLSGTALTVSGRDTELSGKLQDGVVSLTLPNGGELILTLTGKFDLPPEPTPVPIDEAASGDWYGWWAVIEPSGEFAELKNGWWDCRGRLEMRTDGTGVFTLWDENLDGEEPLASLEVKAGKKGLTLTGGWFLSRDAELSFGEHAQYENYLLIIGQYDGFDYEIHLRPWGTLWDDVIETDPTAIPRGYISWYLPLVEENSPMP